MQTITRIALLGSLAATVAVTGTAQATETLRIAGSLRPGSMMMGIIQTFIDNFNAQSGDNYKIQYQLVANDQEMTQQVIRGRLEIGTSGLAATAVSLPPVAVMSMPYLWDNDAQRRWATDNVVRPALEQIFEDNGLVLIGLGDAGWSNLFCKSTCTTPDDIASQRFRVPPAASARAFWENIGVNGVQLSLPDFFTGLEQGMVEGGDLPFTFYVTTPAAQFAKNYVTTINTITNRDFLSTSASMTDYRLRFRSCSNQQCRPPMRCGSARMLTRKYKSVNSKPMVASSCS